jgi:Suppressor of fused protein (SUFU)
MSDEEISAGGSRIYRHEPSDAEPELAHGDEELIEAVSDHVERHVGPIAQVFHELISPTVHLDVLRVDPTDERPWYTLVTCGMSAKPMQAPEPELAHAELTLALPPDWPMEQEDWRDERHYWPVRLLKFLGRVPHEYDTWLGNGHTIPNDDPPEPYARGTRLCGAIVATPLLAPEAFRVLERPAGPTRFYGVVPLHAAEMEFKLDQGADALYDRLADAGVSELVDPSRASTVEAPRRRGLFRRR